MEDWILMKYKKYNTKDRVSRVGFMVTNKDQTTQCRHCGSKSEFLENIRTKRFNRDYYYCPECKKMTIIEN